MIEISRPATGATDDELGCVGYLEFDGVEHYLHVTEKRNRKSRKMLLDTARPLQAWHGGDW